MSEQEPHRNVVELGSPQRVSEGRGGELIEAVGRITVKRSRQLVGKLFENVDDALFDLAEKAENNSVQTRYFDDMREVRRKRQLIERLFVDNVGTGLKQFAHGKLPTVDKPQGTQAKTDESELSLVDESELEESLAITGMTSKAENRYARTLYAVNQRLSVISGGSQVADANNPVGPACLCECFRVAMQELDAEVNAKLLIYKLFERYVISGLESLYDEINDTLVKAGVLPQLRRRRQHRNHAADGQGQAQAGGDGVLPDDDVASPEEQAMREELYATVNNMLAQRRQYLQPAPTAANQGPVLGVRELLGALALLQQQAPPMPADLHSPDADDADSLSAEELKAALRGQIAKVSKDTKAQVSGADEDTIDLVGMLFDYILEDPNLPTQMQAILGRLQIPYLKVAIIDKQLFASESHPARRLLDSMADAAKGWTKESDPDLRLFNETKAIVEKLLHDLGEDTELFDQLLQRFAAFQEKNQTRAERAEQRAAEAAKGKEKLRAARQVAAREVLGRTENAALPNLIRNILTRPWANYLVLTLLRQGENTEQWRAAVQFMDDLIDTTHEVSNDEQRSALRKKLPQIEKTLRHGLATVAFSDDDVRHLMRALGRYYRGLLGEDPASAELGIADTSATGPSRSDAEEDEAVIPASVETIAKPEIIEPPEAIHFDEDAPAMQQAKALKLGSWVEFVADSGQRSRAKLSWISPISGKYLFVNRRGLKVCDMTREALATGIQDGSVVVLEEVPLFDRALDAIVERLKTDQPDDAAQAGEPDSSADKPSTPGAKPSRTGQAGPPEAS